MSFKPTTAFHRGRFLPHTNANGLPQMVTFGLFDMLPRHAFDEEFQKLQTRAEQRAFLERYIDGGRGSCWLNQPELAQMVIGALKFYDGRDYRLLDWVVMPNHVHVVYEKPAAPIERILRNWKSYTAHKGNAILGRSNMPFWRHDYFDRYARSPAHLANMRNYVLLNPVQAGLITDPLDWPYSSARDYGEGLKEALRRWYRQHRRQFWKAIEEPSS